MQQGSAGCSEAMSAHMKTVQVSVRKTQPSLGLYEEASLRRIKQTPCRPAELTRMKQTPAGLGKEGHA